jgi:hypothetical protein
MKVYTLLLGSIYLGTYISEEEARFSEAYWSKVYSEKKDMQLDFRIHSHELVSDLYNSNSQYLWYDKKLYLININTGKIWLSMDLEDYLNPDLKKDGVNTYSKSCDYVWAKSMEEAKNIILLTSS